MYRKAWHSSALGVYIFASIYTHLYVKAPMLGHQSFYLTSWDMVGRFGCRNHRLNFRFRRFSRRSLNSVGRPSNYRSRVSRSCPLVWKCRFCQGSSTTISMTIRFICSCTWWSCVFTLMVFTLIILTWWWRRKIVRKWYRRVSAVGGGFWPIGIWWLCIL